MLPSSCWETQEHQGTYHLKMKGMVTICSDKLPTLLANHQVQCSSHFSAPIVQNLQFLLGHLLNVNKYFNILHEKYFFLVLYE